MRVLGVVSLLHDLSSEVARTLPPFLANVLVVRASIIGLIEGIAESTATSRALISDLVPGHRHLCGNAYGIFNPALRVAAFPASLSAGILSAQYGPAAPVRFGGALSLLALIGSTLPPGPAKER